MNKTNIYVSVRTEEECKRSYEILCRAKQDIWSHTIHQLTRGVTGYYLLLYGDKWYLSSCIGDDKTLITLDEFESILCGNQNTMRDEAQFPNTTYEDVLCGKGEEETDRVSAQQYLNKHGIGSGTNITKNSVVDLLTGFADQQASSLRRELEEKEELLNLMALHSGKIVCTASLSVSEINQARASKRMIVDKNGLGFVWMPPLDKIPETEKEVEFFEKWFPLDEEMPEDLKNWRPNLDNPTN